MEVFRNGVAYVGLGDVVGGKMWFCVNKTKGMNMVWFWTKKECEKYIRDSFSGDDKKYLLKKLSERKGRAYTYC